MRATVTFLLLFMLSPTTAANQRIHVVTARGHRIEVKITEDIGDVSMVRAECVIPAPHDRVWGVLSNYDDLEDIVPALTESRVIAGEDGEMILEQEGRAGLWFFQRDFHVTLEVTEVPGTYIGFRAIGEGSFRHFEGTWQVEDREGGTWVAHRVEIQPDFFAPQWAVRRVARDLMENTIDGVIGHCLEPSE